MKFLIHKAVSRLALPVCLVGCILLSANRLYSQEDSTVVVEEAVEEETPKAKPVKNTFQSVWIIDNQTVMVPVKKTLEMDIMHRFGVVNKGYQDFWGLFAPSNIRLGFSYVPIEKLNVGIGLTKNNMMLDLNAKYALIKQTKGQYPVSISYYVNMAIDTRDKENITMYDGSPIKHSSDR